ncbi:hypothetical protein AX15_002693 [Amanita polypyramis BW_CC]|nr:hypothetical protein AX15_002693 [Amanita polypyramis BW_CC]
MTVPTNMASAPTHTQELSELSTAQTIVTGERTSNSAEDTTKTSPGSTMYTSPQPSPTATRFVDSPARQTTIPDHYTRPDTQRREATFSPNSLPPYIPYELTPSSSKTLVLCFDGTGDQFDADNSNIVQFVSMLKKDDKMKQMVYYQAGVGTYTSPAVATPFMSKVSKLLDEMLAWNINAHVMGGYEFLMQNYVDGDRICIFGFSRGAYTARSLAGMIHKVGLLPADNFQQIPFAYKMYTRTDSIGWDQSNAFKKAFSVDVPIEFVGVWDTVDSVGLIPKRLPFTTSNTIVRTFRHAVSLDEHRSKFKANLWNRPTEEEKNLGMAEALDRANEKLRAAMCERHMRGQGCDDATHKHSEEDDNKNGKHHKSPSTSEANGHNGGQVQGKRPAKIWTLDDEPDKAMNLFESMYAGQINVLTNVEEVWFAGCHCDVGGGSVENGTRYSLARIPLRWMIRECFKTKCGILFKTDSLREVGLDPSTIYPYVLPRPPALLERARTQVIEKIPRTSIWKRVGKLFMSAEARSKAAREAMERRSQSSAFISEEDEELRDALSPKYDQLKLKLFWWILEILPVSIRYQRGDNQWISYIGINMGRPRFIPKQKDHGVKLHRSVQLRMEAQCLKEGDKYEPKARLKVNPTWID